ncbi:MAG: hypothetical protein ACYC42_03625 [Lysobacter sp.]
MRIAIALVFALASFAASAAPTVVSGERANKAQASLDFRIVIPETLHFDSQTQRRKKSQTFVSRTTQLQDGRTLVTVARP